MYPMEMESSEVLSSLSTEDWELRAECMLRYPGEEEHRPSQTPTNHQEQQGSIPGIQQRGWELQV